jgi:hypothetical protein
MNSGLTRFARVFRCEAIQSLGPFRSGWAQFTFVIKDRPIVSGDWEATALSPAAALRLSVDACARSFTADVCGSDAFEGIVSGGSLNCSRMILSRLAIFSPARECDR